MMTVIIFVVFLQKTTAVYDFDSIKECEAFRQYVKAKDDIPVSECFSFEIKRP